jgi:hypothetical protein
LDDFTAHAKLIKFSLTQRCYDLKKLAGINPKLERKDNYEFSMKNSTWFRKPIGNWFMMKSTSYSEKEDGFLITMKVLMKCQARSEG